MDTSSTLFADAVAELAARGIRLTAELDQYVVNFKNGTAATAYVTDDLTDAIAHGRALARSIAPAAPAHVKRRQRRLRMTPKAVNKRRRLAHMRKMRARAIRQEKKE